MFLPGTEPLKPIRMCCTRMWSGSFSGVVDTLASVVWAVDAVLVPPFEAQPEAATRSGKKSASAVTDFTVMRILSGRAWPRGTGRGIRRLTDRAPLPLQRRIALEG